MSNSSDTSIWPLILIAGVLGVVAQMIVGSSTSSTTSATATPNTNSAEYRYTKERFRQEGFNSSDSDAATQAVLKFHAAQKAREK